MHGMRTKMSGSDKSGSRSSERYRSRERSPTPQKKQSHWLDASSQLLMGEDVVFGPAVMWLGKFRVWCSTDGIHTTWFR